MLTRVYIINPIIILGNRIYHKSHNYIRKSHKFLGNALIHQERMSHDCITCRLVLCVGRHKTFTCTCTCRWPCLTLNSRTYIHVLTTVSLACINSANGIIVFVRAMAHAGSIGFYFQLHKVTLSTQAACWVKNTSRLTHGYRIYPKAIYYTARGQYSKQSRKPMC